MKVWPIFGYYRSAEGLPIMYDMIGGSGDLEKARKLFVDSPNAETRFTEYYLRSETILGTMFTVS